VKAAHWILAGTLAFSAFAWASTAQAAQKLKDADCLTCHADPTLTTTGENGATVSLYVDANKLKHSIHGRMFSCVGCHKDVRSLAHETPPQKVSCAQCHADAGVAYMHSIHAKVDKSGKIPASCEDCHGDVHQIEGAGDPKSPINHANIPATCGRCHGQKFLMESNGESAQPFLSYQDSVHGRAVANGSQKAAVCTDCHGTHEILPASDAKSPISKFNVPATCGQCHTDVENTFMQSVHGQAIVRGNQLAPTCTDCHGIHTIKAPSNPSSPVAERNLSRDICARCHEGVRLSQEFGVPGNRVTTYFDSYHGLAAEGGSVLAANCSSCHGVHNILPSSDPRSTINRANLDATCGKCHKGVTQKFTRTPVHLQAGGRSSDIDSVAVRWVRWIYIPLILLVIGAMFLHNAIIWRSKAIARRRTQNPFMQRMTVNQRWQHLVLLSSFIILVITGFALKFPDTWFAHTLGMGEHLRGIIHRIAGVVLIGAGIYHVFYLRLAREGRRLLRDIAPRPQDAFDVWNTLRYYLGLSSEKPKFGRFTYGEKAEYWALVWGTALMGLTGIMIWAKVWVGDLLARWWVDVATAVHFYEAILATLAILVWHFYQVFFDPDVYPMNWAWWDGKMPVELYRHEHELDTESLSEAQPPDAGTPPKQ
jgi:cytochrome b subunit of formate dehydrogenase/nitrate reductase cytochrome c-type subunit/predicted DCC family thiol-disulfide oxidoreductase YuxK